MPAQDLNHLIARYVDHALVHDEVLKNDRQRLAGLGTCADR